MLDEELVPAHQVEQQVRRHRSERRRHVHVGAASHSPQVDEAKVTDFLGRSEFLRRAKDASGLLLESGRSQLKDKIGRSLDAGFFVRVQSRDV